MQSLTTILHAAALLLPAVSAINMTFYNPQCGVDYAFGPFYEELLFQAETPTSGSNFTDFFTPIGTLAVLNNTASGIEGVGALMDAMLPDDGSVVWNHYPNITFVANETDTIKTYQLNGILHIIAAGECSTTYFSTRFTVTKNSTTGIPNLHPHSGSLVEYNGFRVDASEDPCFAPY
ncbi:hypothetical protein C7974DRAFT_424833 [Boeremia exigua]|uniref:uncharacterized protein n=1 Tax=Boeremia exigua TaxID=749465 RepID=UPI001E8CB11C|nr:uncharacterized protein C7974DRAFT_424833 [Boeremia exigua]KAH6625110.1 hypothetical protein C7974DRAFT_424833 [Boeremia exigua]